MARAGLRNHYTFDLENCHPTLIAARHDSAFLKNFVAARWQRRTPTGPASEGAVPEAPLRWQHRELGDGARDDDLSDDGLRARVSEDGESSGCRGLLEEPRRTETADLGEVRSNPLTDKLLHVALVISLKPAQSKLSPPTFASKSSSSSLRSLMRPCRCESASRSSMGGFLELHPSDLFRLTTTSRGLRGLSQSWEKA